MSTRARIGIQLEDGTIRSIYCHHDGYKEGVGETLKKFYNTPEKVKGLMDLGDISSLGETYDMKMSKTDWHRFDLPKDLYEKFAESFGDGKYTVTYKDRGEKGVTARIDRSFVEFEDNIGKCGEEFTYLYTTDFNGVYHWEVAETPYFKEF